jgi:predicted PurR-regulated permease PerM
MMHIPPDAAEQPAQDDLAAQVANAERAWQRLWMRIRTITPRGAARLLLVLAALWGLARLLILSWGVLMPFVVGLAMAYLLLPLVNMLSRWLPRWAAVLAVFIGLIFTLVGAWTFIVPPLVSQLAALAQALPTGDQIQKFLTGLRQSWSALEPQMQQEIGAVAESVFTTLRDSFLTSLQGMLNFVVGSLLTVFNLLGFVLGLVIVPFFIYYVLNDHAEIHPAVDRILPGWLRADFWAMVRIVDGNFSRYIRGQLVLVLIGAAATFLGLVILSVVGLQGVQYRLLLSIFAGLTVLIPYVGFVIAVLAAFGVGAFSSWQTALAMAVVVFIVKQVVDTLFYPIVVGRSVHLHEAIVLLVLVILSEFGFIWVILAPPVAAAARDLFLYAYGRLGDPPRPAGLLPGEPLPGTIVAEQDRSLRADDKLDAGEHIGGKRRPRRILSGGQKD